MSVTFSWKSAETSCAIYYQHTNHSIVVRLHDQVPRMDSEILWDTLKFLNFEYGPAGCVILMYGAEFLE